MLSLLQGILFIWLGVLQLPVNQAIGIFSIVVGSLNLFVFLLYIIRAILKYIVATQE